MEDLSIAIVQTTLHWESPEANLAMLEEKLWDLEKPVDIVVLPEMFNSGFTMNAAKVAEPMGLTTFRWMTQQAKQVKAAVVGSFVINEQGKYYNRLVWMFPDGTYKTYDKRHLFRMAKEDHTYTGGKEKLIVAWKGWRICPMICYDLRFPVWSRNTYDVNKEELAYDCLLYVANWPQARINSWTCLLQARAMENLCYTIGVNRIGEDGMGIAYNGQSAVYGPKGESLLLAEDSEQIVLATLSKSELAGFRQKFPAYLDADNFFFEQGLNND